MSLLSSPWAISQLSELTLWAAVQFTELYLILNSLSCVSPHWATSLPNPTELKSHWAKYHSTELHLILLYKLHHSHWAESHLTESHHMSLSFIISYWALFKLHHISFRYISSLWAPHDLTKLNLISLGLISCHWATTHLPELHLIWTELHLSHDRIG
jgi:hypothetical protein